MHSNKISSSNSLIIIFDVINSEVMISDAKRQSDI